MGNKREGLEIKINVKWCKGCGICVAFCPKKCLSLNENEKIQLHAPEDCIKCGMCELRCPDLAIFLGGKE